MISKEFLSKVLSIDVAHVSKNEILNEILIYERCFKYPLTYNASAYLTINIYELVHKNIKQWIRDNGYETCVFDWSDEPKNIIKDVEEMLTQEKADIEFEKENGGER